MVAKESGYTYRVNFGNGQVHYAGNKRQCQQFRAEHGDDCAFVEWQDPDTLDWFPIGNAFVISE